MINSKHVVVDVIFSANGKWCARALTVHNEDTNMPYYLIREWENTTTEREAIRKAKQLAKQKNYIYIKDMNSYLSELKMIKQLLKPIKVVFT